MKRLLITMLISTVALSGVFASGNKEPFQKLVPNMDIDKFMGPWYVISFLPSFLEKDGVNGIETYSLDAKGNIRVEYILYKGSPDGKKKIMHQKGWIVDKT
ncbi:MAG TPA: lipocalin family protein, partial [Treponemataceae bacterium]|nr:lipocalin family protein [Treponemataceae bacterium]